MGGNSGKREAPEMGDDKSEFQTPDELQDLLERIGLRLHAKNRIAGGESEFYWYLAEALRATGRLTLAGIKNPQLSAEFGDGYEPGSIPKGDRLDHFLVMLKNEMAQM